MASNVATLMTMVRRSRVRVSATSIDLIASFVAAARHASFAAAARELDLTPSAVAKNVARLEARLGVRMFHRTTRQMTLSQDGEAVYARASRILEEIEALEAEVAEERIGPRGTLRIDLPLSYGRQVVLPVLFSLATRWPALQIDARFSDHIVDIVKEGVDAAVRIGNLADSGLVARTFDRQTLGVYASPDYLADHPPPATPEALRNHACVLFRLPSSGRNREWQFRIGRRDVALRLEGAMRLGDGESLVQAAVAGLGIVQVPSYIAAQAVQGGRLVEVLRRFRPAPMPISLVYPGRRHVPLRVRLLAEALVARARVATPSKRSRVS